MESGLSTGQEIILAKACESLWYNIGADVPAESVTAKEMIELVTEGDALVDNNFEQEEEWLKLIIENMGYDEAMKRIADRCAFDNYEGAGADN